MLFSILLVILIVVAIVTVIVSVHKGEPVGETCGAVTAVLLLGIGFGLAILGCGAVIVNGSRDDGGWSLTAEEVYTVAEGSEIRVDNGYIEFVAVEDGVPRPVTVSGGDDMTYTQSAEAPSTVTVRTEFRELGTAIYPWGQGDERTLTTIR